MKGSLKQQKHVPIIVENQNEDPFNHVDIVDNTIGDDLDDFAASAINEFKKKNIERIANGVEKSIRIRSSRKPSAKDTTTTNKGKVTIKNQDKNNEELTNTGAYDIDQMRYEEGFKQEDQNQLKTAEKNEYSDLMDEKPTKFDIFDNYKGEEDNYVCYRFPHLTFCLCPISCQEIVPFSTPIQVLDGIFLSSFAGALSAKNLLKQSITHILNVSATEYTKRTRWFKYLNLDVYNNQDEDIKKYFRITNRFISEAIAGGYKILIHCYDGKSTGPAFLIAYMISKLKITYKKSLDIIKQSYPEIEINEYFNKQLEQYDLEKLAMASTFKRA